METLFEIVLLEEVRLFLKSLDKKHYEKIIYNIRKAQKKRDPELFKKLTDDIWEYQLMGL
ncbi:MAG: hypothetical protein J7539_09730 [Niabella sp.]|nr:hypothetical protein [Niabella sp.]